MIWRESEKEIHLVELTVPHEDNIGSAHERKEERYEELIRECTEKGSTIHFPVEVGCRGYVGISMRKWLKEAGLTEKKLREFTQEIQQVVEKAGHWIWIKRNDETWLEHS